MKTTLFWFSGTGNSLAVARQLADKLGETTLISIAEAVEETVNPTADRVGIIFPVYAWGPPLIVERFCRKLKASSSTYMFGVATCGGSAGATLKVLAEWLARKDMRLSSGFSIQMPGNYLPMGEAPPQETQQVSFSAADRKLDTVVKAIQAQEVRKPETSGFLANLLLTGLVYRFMSPGLHRADKSFWVNANCNGCGTCRKVCPVEDITMESDKPTWHGRCEQCLACLHWCPQAAIQHGKKTEGRQRYHHPDVTLKDFTRR